VVVRERLPPNSIMCQLFAHLDGMLQQLALLFHQLQQFTLVGSKPEVLSVNMTQLVNYLVLLSQLTSRH
jgi:hypothetical protein